MSDKFQKKTEDFVCENCGTEVKGTGYTNHCPKCLTSRHVDVNPGDRKNSCRGLMDPVGVELKKGEYVILHKCRKCGEMKKNKASDDDEFDVILGISGK